MASNSSRVCENPMIDVERNPIRIAHLDGYYMALSGGSKSTPPETHRSLEKIAWLEGWKRGKREQEMRRVGWVGVEKGSVL